MAIIMMGISAGLMDAPALSYMGEISEPRFRGFLASFVSMTVPIGMLVEFFLGSIFDWRTAVAISIAVPVASIIMIAFVSIQVDKRRRII